MYICNCNGLTERQVDAARKGGAQSWPEVYAFYDCAPKCRKCVPDVARRLNGTDQTPPDPFYAQSALSKA
ncbi:MAG: (2Fe-2S)-binding protein [Rhodospirillales bacterium]|nr:(2Fe-2S)-binding protein [Rhodospirillales bacterium]